MKIYLLVLMTFFFAFMHGSCAKTENTLVLESVLDEKLRMERLRQQQVLMKAQTLEQWQQTVAASQLETPELDLLDLPQSFIRLTPGELETLQLETAGIEIPPFTEVAWKDFDRNLYVFAGRVDWDAGYLLSKTKSGFKKILEEKIAAAYQEIHEEKRGLGAATRTYEAGNIIILEIINKYLTGNEWYTDERYFYIYQPDYRLNIFIQGPNAKYEEIAAEMNVSLNFFQAKLNALFPQPIPFQDTK